MIIANPIYDVVLKYLLEDIEIARDLLSVILNERITSLTINPQETTIQSNEGALKIFHLDFKATIDLPDGKQKMVLIELQKAKQSHDIVRFRKYLGDNYIKSELRKNSKGRDVEYALEIVTLYFLGFILEGVEVPILKVGRKLIDIVQNKEIFTSDSFITHLTHESYTIQIPRLKRNQQNELEEVLEIFSQDNITDDLHRLEFKPKHKNALVEKMARRLSKAASNETIRRQMDAEDSFDRIIDRELGEKNRLLLEAEKRIEEVETANEALKRELEEMKKRFGN